MTISVWASHPNSEFCVVVLLYSISLWIPESRTNQDRDRYRTWLCSMLLLLSVSGRFKDKNEDRRTGTNRAAADTAGHNSRAVPVPTRFRIRWVADADADVMCRVSTFHLRSDVRSCKLDAGCASTLLRYRVCVSGIEVSSATATPACDHPSSCKSNVKTSRCRMSPR